MKTEQLIRALVADARPVRRLPKASERCARWLGLALALVGAGATLWGLRPDLAEKTSDAFFLLESASLLLTFVVAARSSFELSVPDDKRGVATFLLPPLGLLLWFVLVLIRSASDAAGLALATSSGLPCVLRILGLGALPLAACWAMLRRAAPQLEGWTGLFMSLSAFSLGAVAAQMLCASDGAPHVLEWHCVPVLLLASASGCLGSVVFRRGASAERRGTA